MYFINLFIYLWLHWVFVAARGLFSSCGERGLLFVAVRGLLIAVASLVAEHGLQGFSSCGWRAQLPRGTWDLSGPGLEPVSPALAGGFLTTAPPGKPTLVFKKMSIWDVKDHFGTAESWITEVWTSDNSRACQSEKASFGEAHCWTPSSTPGELLDEC